MKTKQDFQKLSIDELNAEVLTLRKSQFQLRMKKANGSLDKPHVIKVIRRNIARIKTILTEKVGMSHVE